LVSLTPAKQTGVEGGYGCLPKQTDATYGVGESAKRSQLMREKNVAGGEKLPRVGQKWSCLGARDELINAEAGHTKWMTAAPGMKKGGQLGKQIKKPLMLKPITSANKFNQGPVGGEAIFILRGNT